MRISDWSSDVCSSDLIAQARYVNNAIDRLDGAITTYLATLDQDAMNREDHQRRDEILAFASNMAHAGNIATGGLLGHTATLRKKGWAFTAAQRDELTTILDRDRKSTRLNSSQQ